MKRDKIILLMGHGSRDGEGALEFMELAGAVQQAIPKVPVEAGVLEFNGPVAPSIQEAIDRCAAMEAGRVLAVPVLLSNAGHAKNDMPAQIAQARARHPTLDLREAALLGIHASLLEIAEERIEQLGRRLGPADPKETAVLLVGRGASDAEANADFYKIGRLLWERSPFGVVECCFISLAEPGVPAGIERCVQLGASRVLVVPYFINTGILVKRISEQALKAQECYPSTRIAVGEHFGVHPKLVQLILARAAALTGDVEGGED